MWLIFLLLTVSTLLLVGMRRVREGEMARLNRFGRPAGLLAPGVHWLLPGEAIATRVSMLGRHLDLTPRRIHSGAHTARVAGRIYFQLLDARTAPISDAEVDARVQDVVLTRLSGSLAHLVELSASERNQCLREDLRPMLRADGILLTRLELAIHTHGKG